MRIGIVTLGCDKNTVDSEYIAGWLDRRGVEVVRGELEDLSLDAAAIMTCGFIDAAREESVHAIQDWIDSKADRPKAFVLAVAGCLSQTRADELRKELPQLDLIAGVGEFAALAGALVETIRAKRGETLAASPPATLVRDAPNATIAAPQARLRLDRSTTAYLKIADGCDYACAFCAIPSMKGRYRSVPREIVLAEARSLLESGAKEIVLVAQDVSAYGRDLDGGVRLPPLLRDLCALPGDFWLRIMYFYPGGFSDELIEVMASEPKICPYLDIPLQHLDPGICAAMKRPYSEVKVWDWIERLRRAIPGVALRTTFIVGFPGEGKKDFMLLLNGLRRIRFDNVGFFPFSAQDGTLAATMPGQAPERTKMARCERLARRQREIAEEVNQRFVGRVVDVLIDGRFPETNLHIGHSRAQAPEVDGMTRFVSETELEPGQIVPVAISRAEGFDLIGETRLTAAG